MTTHFGLGCYSSIVWFHAPTFVHIDTNLTVDCSAPLHFLQFVSIPSYHDGNTGPVLLMKSSQPSRLTSSAESVSRIQSGSNVSISCLSRPSFAYCNRLNVRGLYQRSVVNLNCPDHWHGTRLTLEPKSMERVMMARKHATQRPNHHKAVTSESANLN